MSHRNARTASRAAAGLAAILIVGLGVAGPAYAQKPADPPGQAKAVAGTDSANTAAAATDSAQGSGGVEKATTTKAASEKAAALKSTSKATKNTKASAAKGPDHSGGTAGTSGDPSQPQPPSNADQNGGGANHSGAYDSTRDGSPSMNGNGGGQAKGKPCAGCVGKADNKNPKGQNPNGSDPNAGYECDRNHGVGRSNPAHTGCRTTTPPEECPPGTTGTPPNCDTVQPPEECPPGTTGTPPNCDTVQPPEECPPGTTGTPPNCTGGPPPGCVDLPETPADECGTPNECVDNPATPKDECGEVGPPAKHNPPGKHGQGGPKPKKGVLPNTGAPDGLFLAAFGGLALLAGGAGLNRRGKHAA